MKWTAKPEKLQPRHFQIKYDPAAGYYLSVFEGNECVRDYLQDTFQIAIEAAHEDYDVPMDSWVPEK